MAKGENIFRRRDGRWEARYIKGRELSGKIKYGYCYGKTYREAKEKAAKRKAALANGAPLPTARTQKPFSSYCLEWLHTKKCTVKESTYSDVYIDRVLYGRSDYMSVLFKDLLREETTE